CRTCHHFLALPTHLFFHWLRARPHLHSFPTRRSSDLTPRQSLPTRSSLSPARGFPGLPPAQSPPAPPPAPSHALPTPALSGWHRSEEHTSELQSRFDLVCRLLLEKKNQENKHSTRHLH